MLLLLQLILCFISKIDFNKTARGVFPPIKKKHEAQTQVTITTKYALKPLKYFQINRVIINREKNKLWWELEFKKLII